MCIIRPQTGQIRSRTSSSQYAKSVSAGQRCGIVWTSLSRGSVPVVLKADKEDTREMAWFLAGCLAVDLGRPPEGAVYVRKPPLGAGIVPEALCPSATTPPPVACPTPSGMSSVHRHCTAESTPDRSKLFGSHGQRPWI